MDVIIVSESVIALGVDQGIANCGYSVVELTALDEVKILTSGTIVTSSKLELSKRIGIIYNTINHLAKEYNVNILGCEKLFFSPKQKSDTNKGGRNKSASIVYTNMATGVLYLIADQNNLHLKEFVPGTVKKYVAGHGRASKQEVEEAVNQIVDTLDKKIETEHEADSIAIGITSAKFKKDLMMKGLEREIKVKKPNGTKAKKEAEAKKAKAVELRELKKLEVARAKEEKAIARAIAKELKEAIAIEKAKAKEEKQQEKNRNKKKGVIET